MQNFIFDFDGTLADSGKTAVLATQAAFRDFNLKEPTAATVQYYMGSQLKFHLKKWQIEIFQTKALPSCWILFAATIKIWK
nr:HAD hydrolase-like protein [Liquorilactobacillus satsumensis]